MLAPGSSARLWTITVAVSAATLLLAIVSQGHDIGRPFHTVFETAAVSMALFVGVLAAISYRSVPDERYLYLTTAFIGAAALDTWHALVTSDWFLVHVELPSPFASVSVWSWATGRIFLGIMLLLGALRETLAVRGREAPLGPIGLTTLSVAILIAVLVSFTFVPLPPAYLDPTAVARPQELIAALLFIGALSYRQHLPRRQHDPLHDHIVASLWLGVVTQIALMMWSDHVHDSWFVAAHVLKVASYGLVGVGLLLEVGRLYDRIEEQRARLETQNRLLAMRNEDLDRFGAAISHDLREPLRMIRNFTQLIERRLGQSDGLDQETKEFMGFVTDGAERMDERVTGLLEWSRSGVVAGSGHAADVAQALTETLQDLSGVIGEHNARIEMSVEGSVAIAPDRLRQVFQNLVTNALRHHDRRAPPRVRIWTRALGRDLEIMVEDDGPGIPEAMHERVFELFHRGRAAQGTPGSGIGLAIVRRIVDSYGGTIHVEDAVPHGARFVIRLPRVGPYAGEGRPKGRVAAHAAAFAAAYATESPEEPAADTQHRRLDVGSGGRSR